MTVFELITQLQPLNPNRRVVAVELPPRGQPSDPFEEAEGEIVAVESETDSESCDVRILFRQ